MNIEAMKDWAVQGVKFDHSRWRNTGISEDDVGLGYSGVCERFACQGEFENGKPLKPVLVKNAQGFRVCPCCGSSYGRGEL